MVSIRELKLWVLAGNDPKDFDGVEVLGGGAQQSDGVFKVGNYIVKKLRAPAFWADHYHANFRWEPPKMYIPVRGLRASGLCRPRYWTLGKGWVAQVFYPTTIHAITEGRRKTTKAYLKGADAKYRGQHLDIHGANYGLNRHGLLTAFDW